MRQIGPSKGRSVVVPGVSGSTGGTSPLHGVVLDPATRAFLDEALERATGGGLSSQVERDGSATTTGRGVRRAARHIRSAEQAIRLSGISQVDLSCSLERMLAGFNFRPDRLSARLVFPKSGVGGPRIQIREELGISQMYTRGRPDSGEPSFLESIISLESQVEMDHWRDTVTPTQALTAQHELWMFHKRAFALFALGDYVGCREDAERVITAVRLLNELDFPFEQHVPQFVVSLAKAWMIKGRAQLWLLASQGDISAVECADMLRDATSQVVGNIRELLPGPFGRFDERSRTEAIQQLEGDLRFLLARSATDRASAGGPEVYSTALDIEPIIDQFPFVTGEMGCRWLEPVLGKARLQVRTPLGVAEFSVKGSPDGESLWDGSLLRGRLGTAPHTCESLLAVGEDPYSVLDMAYLDYAAKIFAFRARVFRKGLHWPEGAIHDEREVLRILSFAFSGSPTGNVRTDLLDRLGRQELRVGELVAQWLFICGRRCMALDALDRSLARASATAHVRAQCGLTDLTTLPIHLRLLNLRDDVISALRGGSLSERNFALQSDLTRAVGSGAYEAAARLRERLGSPGEG